MIGTVDDAGRALLTLQIQSSESAPATDLIVWVDTAFDGELVVPRSQIEALALPSSGVLQGILANGMKVQLDAFYAWVNWFGEARQVEVIAREGTYPLLGTALLRGRRLLVDYRTSDVQLD